MMCHQQATQSDTKSPGLPETFVEISHFGLAFLLHASQRSELMILIFQRAWNCRQQKNQDWTSPAGQRCEVDFWHKNVKRFKKRHKYEVSLTCHYLSTTEPPNWCQNRDQDPWHLSYPVWFKGGVTEENYSLVLLLWFKQGILCLYNERAQTSRLCRCEIASGMSNNMLYLIWALRNTSSFLPGHCASD